MIFELFDTVGNIAVTETYFSIGGGFINTLAEVNQLQAPLKMESSELCPYPFDSAITMLHMATDSGKSIAEMKYINELQYLTENEVNEGIDKVWSSMKTCLENGLEADGILPGGLNLARRAKNLHHHISQDIKRSNVNDLLCAYAMAVNEENAAGNMVVTAPTNGAAGVIPAVLYSLTT